jgi:MFS family permease
VVFGWVFAAHQLGAAAAASAAGWVRDATGTYDPAFYAAAGLCVVAAALCAVAGNRANRVPVPALSASAG